MGICMLVVLLLRECISDFVVIYIYLQVPQGKIVNKAVLKYGLKNFVFIVIETVSDPLRSDKKAILNLEQKYLDQLNPAYNIVKIAGSVLNLK